MNKILEMGNGKMKRYLTFKEHLEKARIRRESNLHEMIHRRCSRGIRMNANVVVKSVPEQPVPELVDITDPDFEWIEQLPDDIKVKMYCKLCALGVPYLA